MKQGTHGVEKTARRGPRRRQRGASGLAYGLIVGLVAVVAIGAISVLGTETTALFGEVGTRMDSVAEANQSEAQGDDGGDGAQTTNSPPSFTIPADLGSFDEQPGGSSHNATLTADDPDQDMVSFALIPQGSGGASPNPPGLSVASGGAVSWDLPPDDQVPGDTSFSFTVEADDGQGGTAQRDFTVTARATLPTDSLISEWTMDSILGGNAVEDTVSDNDGTMLGNVAQTTGGGGIIGEAMAFDGQGSFLNGTADIVTMGDQPDLEPDEIFSVSVWINAVSVGGLGNSILSKRPDCSLNFDGIGLHINESGGSRTTHFFNFGPPQQDNPHFEDAIDPPGNWNHVVVIRDGVNAYLVTNGSDKASSATLTLPDSRSMANSAPFALGANACDTSNFLDSSPEFGDAFDGLIDQVRYYDKALTDAEIKDLYNNGNGL